MYLATSTVVAVYAFLQIRGVGEAFPREPFIMTRVITLHFSRCKPATRIAKEDAHGYCSNGCSNLVDPFLEQGPGRRGKEGFP
jgi:hypothetical protein